MQPYLNNRLDCKGGDRATRLVSDGSQVWGLNGVQRWKRLRLHLFHMLFVCCYLTNLTNLTYASGNMKMARICNPAAHIVCWLHWRVPSAGWSSSCGWWAPGRSRGGSELDDRWAGGLRWATDARSPQTQSSTWGYLKKEDRWVGGRVG